jgi:hypothetical protein
VAIVGAIALAGYLGDLHGEHVGHSVSVLSGVVDAGAAEAGVEARGWVYGVPPDVPWYSPDGTEHYGSRPSCLRSLGTARIQFGAVSYNTNGALNGTVVWVRC